MGCAAMSRTVHLGFQVVVLLAFANSGLGQDVFWSDIDSWVRRPCGPDGVETPPAGFVFPVQCSSDFDCSTLTFTVMVNASLASEIVFSTGNPDYFEDDQSVGCSQPTGVESFCFSAFPQRCGTQSLGRLTAHEGTDCTGPVCNEDGTCTCTTGAGQCHCFHGARYTVKPKTDYRPLLDSQICFNATMKAGPAMQRCVYVDLLLPPDELEVSVSGTPNDWVDTVDAIVGKELELTVFAKDRNTHQGLTIDIQTAAGNSLPTVELPNQEWQGPAVCVTNEADAASVGAPCTSGWWKRALRYTAREMEINTLYRLFFMAREVFWGPELLAADVAVPLSSRQALPGSGCCSTGGVCTVDNFRCSAFPRDIRHSNLRFFSVSVLQVVPTFVPSIAASSRLFRREGTSFFPVAPPNFAGTPPDGGMLPTAYVNCPMPAFGAYAHKEDALDKLHLDISFSGDGHADPSVFGLTYTTDEFFYRNTLENSQDPNDYLLYKGVRWTPQPGSEGSTFRICFRAYDDVSSSTTCAMVHVARCMYCTLPGESLVSIAKRFQTNWLQVWAANDPDVVADDAAALEASEVSPWAEDGVRKPHDLSAGVLIRLGPTLHTRHDMTLEEIADRYQTTVRSLLQVNPDLHEGVIPMQTEVCVLPGICSPHDPQAEPM